MGNVRKYIVQDGEACSGGLFVCIFHQVDVLQDTWIAVPEFFNAQDERIYVYVLEPISLRAEVVEKIERHQLCELYVGVFETACLRIFDNHKDKVSCSAFFCADKDLVGKLCLPFLLHATVGIVRVRFNLGL